MFTGIVQEVGRVAAIDQVGDSARLTITAASVLDGVTHGASIAVNGVCLTVTDHNESTFAVDVMAESLRRSSLGALAPGSGVNLERAVRADGHLDGHIVQGHVDGVGTVEAVDPSEHWTQVSIRMPADLARYVVQKGSIALDGVSLTVSGLVGDLVTVSLIPTTLSLTTLGERRPGDPINVEVDVLAKYTERLLINSRAGQGA